METKNETNKKKLIEKFKGQIKGHLANFKTLIEKDIKIISKRQFTDNDVRITRTRRICRGSRDFRFRSIRYRRRRNEDCSTRISPLNL